MRLAISSMLVCGLAFAAEDPAVKAFNDRLAEYVKIRNSAIAKATNLPKQAKAEQIEAHEKALVETIRKARPNAMQGDILTPEIQKLFRSILASNLKGTVNQDTRAAVKEGNPKHERAPGEVIPVVEVNGIYPDNAPLSTVPPLLLLQLPKLPADIEYRFVGRTLLLRDSKSNLIIDYMKEAAPGV